MQIHAACRLVVVLLALLVALPTPAQAQTPGPVAAPSAASPCGPEQAYELPSGALGLVCQPVPNWNGDVIVYAHGYIDPTVQTREFAIPPVAQPNGTTGSLATLVQDFGYAFAATTYRRNGLAVLEGVQDVRELVATLPEKLGRAPNRVLVLGFSEGGLIATLFAERYPLALNGVIAACGPIGDFRRQIEYFGDFRVLFDSYFPGVLPGSAIEITAELIQNWDSVYAPRVAQVVAQNPQLVANLLADAHAPPTDALTTTLGVLRYNVFSTNDARQQLGGNPYGNVGRFPNRTVATYTAEVTATNALQAYQTSGALAVPLITAHTSDDEIVPVVQQQLYIEKTKNNGFATHRTFTRYGHCRFEGQELLGSFFELARRSANFGRVFLPLPLSSQKP